MVGVLQEEGRDALEKSELHCERRFSLGQTGPIGNPKDMGVNGHRRLAKCGIEHDVGGFAPNARQPFEGLAVARYDAAMFLDENPAGLDQVARFAAKSPIV